MKKDNRTRMTGDDAAAFRKLGLDPAYAQALREKLEYFAFLVECHQQHGLVCRDLDCQANLIHCKTAIRVGKKFVKVDVGTSGRYMVDLATGIIHGIRSYGVIHRGHSYGSLNTVDLWYWGFSVGVRVEEGVATIY
jgi:hypothetical protein